jgi:hypothetical protein
MPNLLPSGVTVLSDRNTTSFSIERLYQFEFDTAISSLGFLVITPIR